MKIQSIIIASMALFAVACNSGTKKTEQAEEKQTAATIVTEANFPAAYSSMRIAAIAKLAGGVNKFYTCLRYQVIQQSSL